MTGAIFARGSCRALKWLALFGVVFALGVGSAAAQNTLTMSGNAEGTIVDLTLTLQTAVASDTTFNLSEGTENNPATPNINESAAPYAAEANDVVFRAGRDTIVVLEGETTGTTTRALDLGEDTDAEDEYFSIEVTGGPTFTAYLMVDDTDDQTYPLKLTNGTKNGETKDNPELLEEHAASPAPTLTLTADPVRSVALADISFEINASAPREYDLGTPSSTSLGTGATDSVTVAITAGNDGNRDDEDITVTAYTGTGASKTKLSDITIKVTDAHKLPIIVGRWTDSTGNDWSSQTPSLDEGDDIYLKLIAAEETTLGGQTPVLLGEDVTVTLAPGSPGLATSADYTLDPAGAIEIEDGKSESSPIKLTLTEDADTAAEVLSFDATATGASANGPGEETTAQVLSLTINGTAPPADLTFTGTGTQDDIIDLVAGTLMTPVQLPTATGGTSPYTYTATPLPAGLSVAETTGMLSGTPTTAGTTSVTYTATDSATPAATGSLTFDITVQPAGTTPPPTGAAPTFLSGSFEPGSAVVTITMSERVWGGGDAVPATHFTIQGDAANTAVSHTVAMSAGGASATFGVTFTNAFSTGQPPTVVYTAPATNVGGHIVDTDNNRLASGTQAATETDILPKLPDLATHTQNLRKDELITPIQLPEVTGGAAMGSNGTVAYSTGALPEGLSFNATTRQITGTPTKVTNGAMAITYIAVDNDANITPSTPDTATGSFSLTVQDAPDKPDAPTVAVTSNTSGSLTVTWTAPHHNNSPITDYEVQHRAVGAATWKHTTQGTETSRIFDGLTNGTTYEFQVRARNAIGWSEWSEIATGVPMLSGALPDVPDAPTVTTGKTQGALDVSWKAPNSNGSSILDYGLRYKVQSSPDWTVMGAAVTGTSTTLSGLPASTTYEVQVRARNANGSSDWSKSGTGRTAAAPVAPTVRGQITSMKMMYGSSARSLTEVDKIVVGGPDSRGHNNRYHVREGDNDKWLQVEVQWTHEEIAAIGYNTAQTVWVQIMSDRYRMPLPIPGVNWVSWIDEEGDADFPQGSTLGRLMAQVTVRTPLAREVDYKGSPRHVKARKGQVRVLLPVDQHEAENDAFYIEATGGDVDLAATAAVNLTTPVVIIEDLTPQNVRVARKRGEPPVIYEGAPSPASSTVAGQAFYTVSASPARIDLPLQVRLDLTDPEGAVRTGDVSLSHSGVTLNPNMDGTGNSQHVYLALPIPDGNRVDDEYTLQASVVDYSLTSGGEDNTVSPASVDITVYDRHKIPTIHMVNPAMQSVAEGDTVDITVTVNRNPADTIVHNIELRQYTSEELTVTLSPERSEDFRITTNPVEIPKHNGRAPWTQKATFTIEAITDDDVDMDTVTFDVEIAGTVAANGSETREMEEAATVNITDETEKLVWAKTADEVDAAVEAAIANAAGADGLNPGDVVEILGAELFDALPGIVVDYSGASSDTAVATGSGSDRRMITVTPMAEGMAMVTVTATATSASGATIVDQTKPNVAQIMFSVDVVLQDLTFTVTGPDEMNLAEGGMGGMVKVTTNRPVTENTEVMLMRDGSSSAGDTDYELNPPLVTIMAGATEGSTMVTAVEDNMAEDMEMLTLFLVVDGMQMTDKSVSFYIWDAAVPALPVIAQLLLAAFLAVGGYRRYRRR